MIAAMAIHVSVSVVSSVFPAPADGDDEVVVTFHDSATAQVVDVPMDVFVAVVEALRFDPEEQDAVFDEEAQASVPVGDDSPALVRTLRAKPQPV